MHIQAPALFAYHDRHVADFEAFAVELSRLEGGSRAFLCASWPAALALAALGTVGPGGHLLYHHDVAADSLHWFQRAAATLGIHAEPLAADEPAKVPDGLAKGARAVFAQQLPEDVVRELDTKALAWHCRAFGAHLFVDNTELTPVHFLSAGRTPTMTLVSPSQGTSGVGHGSSLRMRTGLEPAAALWPPLAAALAIGGDSLVAAAPSEP
jgi:O-acetylhomoserine/O-acetylserine sulfhydrylase-like pyridoxal-dependent enzyme